MSAEVGLIVAAAAEVVRQEEEEMTPYTPKDLAEGWEFKIVRSSFGAFGNPKKLQAVLDEEKRGGWVLVEKFDDCRVRLKRRPGTKKISGDFADTYDPYRTTVGTSHVPIAIVAVIVAVILTLVLFALALGRL
jgi:hypothetical protein